VAVDRHLPHTSFGGDLVYAALSTASCAAWLRGLPVSPIQNSSK
jgi:hypothetical protein